MDQIRQYVLTVTAAALLVSILTGLTGGKTILRIMGGIFLAFTVIGPIADVGIGDIGTFFDAFSYDGEAVAAQGEIMAQEAYCSYIKSEAQAYILDKAKAYGAALEVDVTVDVGGIPHSVQLRGNVSPYAKRCLEEMMAEELGISKEYQTWLG